MGPLRVAALGLLTQVLPVAGAAQPGLPPAHAPAHVLVKLAPGGTAARLAALPTAERTAALEELAARLGGYALEPLFDDPLSPLPTERVSDAPSASLPAMPEPAVERLARHGCHGLDRWYRLEVAGGERPSEAVSRLQQQPEIEVVEIDIRGRSGGQARPLAAGDPRPRRTAAGYFPDDPYLPRQWHLYQIAGPDVAAPPAWTLSRGAPEVPVAVLDTGIDPTHPDLAGAVLETYGRNYITPGAPPDDDHGHGTHIAGLLGAIGDNGIGGAGVAFGVGLVSLKVLDEAGEGFYSRWAAAIVFAADLGVRVINISAGGSGYGQALHDAVRYAHDRGAVIVAAMMNQNSAVPNYPAAFAETIAVGATDARDRRARPFFWDPGGSSGSNYGAHIDLVAPGDSLFSTWLPPARYGWGGGTSQAVPLVAGGAALLLALNPRLAPEGVRSLLRQGARDRVGPPDEDSPGFDIYYGAGRLDLEASLLAAGAAAPPPVAGRIVTPHPNPSSGLVRFGYELTGPATVSLTIYDVRGRLVRRVLAGASRGPGHHREQWDGTDAAGRPLASGIYIWELRIGSARHSGALTLVR